VSCLEFSLAKSEDNLGSGEEESMGMKKHNIRQHGFYVCLPSLNSTGSW
jgi:hypothetical protein